MLKKLSGEAGSAAKAMSTCASDTGLLQSEINNDSTKPHKDPLLETHTQITVSACATARQDALQLQSTLRGTQ